MGLKIHSSKRTTSLAALVVNKGGGERDNNHENRIKHSSNVNADSQNYTLQKGSDSSNQCPRKGNWEKRNTECDLSLSCWKVFT